MLSSLGAKSSLLELKESGAELAACLLARLFFAVSLTLPPSKHIVWSCFP